MPNHPCSSARWLGRNRHGWTALLALTIGIGSCSLAGAAQVIAGNAHSLQVRDDSTLWSWGANTNGQLGDGTRVTKSTPVQVLNTVAMGAAGFAHTLAVKKDGTLWVWGSNAYGQLGDGTTVGRSNPKPTLSNIKLVAAGGSRSHAVKADDSLWSWGFNGSGQLGDGTTTSHSIPVQVLTNVQAVAAGGSHTLALRNDGTVWAWGSNSSGQLGDGSTVDKKSPSQIQALSGIRAIAAGTAFSMALTNDGRVLTWGSNSLGQLGDGSTTARPSPVPILTGIAAIAAGGYHGLALRSDGRLVVWGDNVLGQLGNGTRTNSRSPVQVQTAIVGMAGGTMHSIAARADGTVLTWGSNVNGELGDGGVISRSSPFALFADAQGVAAGANHSAALKNDGSVWAWGDNSFGQLGTVDRNPSGTPLQVLAGAKAVVTGRNHTVALRADNSVWTWGINASGQLGDGTTNDRDTPSQVFAGALAVAAGPDHTLAIKLDGALWAWGGNAKGQLGTGATSSSFRPVQILTDVMAVSAGAQHTVALREDGSIWAWGSNEFGQLGDGTTVNKLSPVPVLVSGGQSVSAGTSHTLATRSDGTLWAWGWNAGRQIGDGTTTDRARPVQVLSNVQSMVAGHDFNIARQADGVLLMWGSNHSGKLGPGVAGPFNPVPSENAFLRNAAAFAAGVEHSLAVDALGQVVTWGNNSDQQLGIARIQLSATAIALADPVAPFSGTVLVVEYFNASIVNGAGNPGIGHYFITASAVEAAGIDAGTSGPGWQRTRRLFRAWTDPSRAPANSVPVCRFYARAPNSHFFTAEPAECRSLRDMNPENDPNAGWAYEGIDFHTVLPVSGKCGAGFTPVYRSYNNRFSPNPAQNDGNHRLTSSYNDHQRAIDFFGYRDEGIAFCSPTNEGSAGADLQATLTYPGAAVGSGAAITAEFRYSNSAAGSASGARIHAAVPPEMTTPAVTCTASGGAVCPVSLHLPLLRSGVEVGTWPPGGVLTVSVVGTAPVITTGVIPTLAFGSSVAAASGTADSNSANNTPPVSISVLKPAAGCNPAFSPSTLVLGPESGPVDVPTFAGAHCMLNVEYQPPWLSVAQSSGSDKLVLSLTPQENTDSAPRTDKLVISSKSILITQLGRPVNQCTTLRLQRDGDQINAEGLSGATSFTVYAEAGCEWFAQANVAWIKVVAGGSGKGNGAVSYVVDANTSFSDDRQGQIQISGSGFTVKQFRTDAGTGQNGSDGGGDSGDGGGAGSSGGDSGGDSG